MRMQPPRPRPFARPATPDVGAVHQVRFVVRVGVQQPGFSSFEEGRADRMWQGVLTCLGFV